MKVRRSDQCRALLQELVDYADGDLPPSRCRTLLGHLSRCACCAGFVDELRRSVEACRAHGGPSVPASVRRRAKQRIRELLSTKSQ